MLTKRTSIIAASILLGCVLPAMADGPVNNGRAPIWDGFYVGAHAGYGRTSGDDNGGIFGAHGGYRWSFGTTIVGVEADISGTGIDRTVTASYGGVTATATASMDYLATIRFVGGVNLGPAFLYTTGGLGLGGASAKVSAHGYGASATAEANVSLAGSVFGGGIEGRATDKISIRAEVLHYSFTRASVDGVTFNGDFSATVLRTGVSMKLN